MDGRPNLCIRRGLPIAATKKAIQLLIDVDKWPQWYSEATRILASKSGTLEKGCSIALHSMNRGALIETRWIIEKIREGYDFLEIQMGSEGQSRMDREVGRSIVKQQLYITALARNDGGIEISSYWKLRWSAKLFGKSINSALKQQSERLLDDLCSYVINEEE